MKKIEVNRQANLQGEEELPGTWDPEKLNPNEEI